MYLYLMVKIYRLRLTQSMKGQSAYFYRNSCLVNREHQRLAGLG
jgi:hypothetical protein